MDEPQAESRGGSGSESVARVPARRFGDDDITRILRTAVELQERSALSGSDSPRGLTLDEIRQVALEAGIDPRYVDIAASRVSTSDERQTSLFFGGPVRWHFQTSVDGEVPERDRDQLLQAIRAITGEKGEVADVWGRMEWSHNEGVGPTIVGITSRDGRTNIDVSASKSEEATVITLLGSSFGGIALGAGLAGLLGLSGPAVLPGIGAMAALSYLGTRTAWHYRARWWERRLRELVDRVAGAAADTAVVVTPGEGQE